MNPGYFQNALPAPALRDFIRHYSFIEVPAVEVRRMEFRALPGCGTSVVLFLGEPSLQREEDRLVRLRRCTLTGFYSRSHLFLPRETLRQVIVHFEPWGMQPFLDFSLSDLTDGRAELEDIFPEGLDDLLKTLGREGPTGRWKPALDRFFRRRLHSTVRIDVRGVRIARHIKRVHGTTRLEELSEKLALGKRTIQRLIHNASGINYKFFAKLARMEYARRLLNARKVSSLTDVALQAGYYDQAHFTHEFQSAYGETPGSYLEKREKLVWNRLQR